MPAGSAQLFLGVFATYMVTLTAGRIALAVSRNVAFKKRLLLVYLGVGASMVPAFGPFIKMGSEILIPLGILACAVSVFQYHDVRFCLGCGRTTWGTVVMRQTTCPECGRRFDS